MEFKGITVGTYISRKPKNKNEKDICTNCEINTKIQKGKYIDKEKALADALQYKLDIDKNGGPRIITKSNKTLVELNEVVNYLSSLSKYSESTVKQNYELLCMGFGEALILDYKKDIILSKNKVEIRRTQTKDDKGNIIIGDTTKTDNGRRILVMKNIYKI